MYLLPLLAIPLSLLAVHLILRRERAKMRATIAALAPATAPERILNVRDLLPAYSAADPGAPTAGVVRLALRSHSLWVNQLNCIVLGFGDLLAVDCSDETRATMLCELYSRAIFESAFAHHFDGADPCTDKLVLQQIADALGGETARMVHDRVHAAGVTLRSLRPAAAAKPSVPPAPGTAEA